MVGACCDVGNWAGNRQSNEITAPYYPTEVQITPKTSTNITRYFVLQKTGYTGFIDEIQVAKKKKKQFGVLDNKSRCLYFDLRYGLVKIRHNS